MRGFMRRQGMRGVLAAALIVLMVIAPPGTVATAAQSPSASAPLDLAAMTINPLDLNPFGLTGYGLGDGGYLDRGDILALLAGTYQRPGSSLQSVLDTNVPQGGYTSSNDLLSPTNPGATGLVASTVLQFGTPAEAGAVYAALTDWSAVPGADPSASNPGVADASQIVSLAGGGGESPSTATTLLTFQSDVSIGFVAYTVSSPSGNEEALTGQIGARLAQKIDAVSGGNAPRLSYRGLELPDLAPESGLYLLAYGGELRLTGETDDEFANRPYAGTSMTDLWRQTWMISPAHNPVAVTIDLAAFGSDADAAGWIATAANREIPGSNGTTVQIPTNDDSGEFTYALSDGRTGRLMLARSGSMTASIDVEGTTLPTPSDQRQLLDAQLTCLAVDATCAAVALPPSFGETTSSTAMHASPASSPTPAVTPTPTMTSTPSVVPSPTASPTPTNTATASPTPTSTATPTASPTSAPSPTPTATATRTISPSPTATATATAMRVATVVPTATMIATAHAPSPTLRATAPPVMGTPTLLPASPIASPHAASPAASPIATSTRTYTNATYGFSVTYDTRSWTIDQQGPVGNLEYALFDNGVSKVYFIAGTTYKGDVNTCVRAAATSLASEDGVTNAQAATDASGTPLAGTTPDGAFAVYTYVDGSGRQFARYFECRVIVPGESTLLIMQVVPLGSFNQQIGDRVDLIEGTKISGRP